MPNNGNPEAAATQVQPVAEAPQTGRLKKALAMAVAAGALTFGALELAESDRNPAAEAVAEVPAVPGAECVDANTQPVFYADQAPAGSNHFGPSAPEAAFTDANVAYSDLIERLCNGTDGQADPALMTGLHEYFGLSTFASPDQRDAAVVANMMDKTAWDANADALIAEMATYDAKLETVSGSYFTMYMIPGARDGRPEIRQSQEHMTDKVVLNFTRTNADGTVTTKRLKLECGDQPVELEEFPDIPHIPENPDTPDTIPPTTGTIPPTTGTIPPKVAVPPVEGGPSTTVEAPTPGPSTPSTSIVEEEEEETPPSTVEENPEPTIAPTTMPPRP